jgi:hypothetical protein
MDRRAWLFLIMLMAGVSFLASCKPKVIAPPVQTITAPLYGHDLLTGKAVRLEDYRGKWVLLDIWASW